MPETAGKSLQVPGANDERIIAIRRSANEQMGMADMIVIDSHDMYEIANEALSEIHAQAKALDAKKTAITGPLNTVLKEVRALFKPAEDALDIAKSTLKRKMLAYQSKVQAERAEAERQAREAQAAEIAAAQTKLAEAQRSGDAAAELSAELDVACAEVATPHVAAPPKPDGGGHALGETWKAAITDEPAFLRFMADQIEAKDERFNNTLGDYKMRQLNAFGSATKGTVPIPGVTFTKERTLAAR